MRQQLWLASDVWFAGHKRVAVPIYAANVAAAVLHAPHFAAPTFGFADFRAHPLGIFGL
jgi:hypothetical protein